MMVSMSRKDAFRLALRLLWFASGTHRLAIKTVVDGNHTTFTLVGADLIEKEQA